MMEACKTCATPVCVTKISLFSSLDDKQRKLLLNRVVRRNLKKGEVFIHESDSLSALAVVNRGRFKAYTLTQSGRQQLLYLFRTGEFFGQNTLFSPQESPYTVEAMEDSGICMIEGSTLRDLVAENAGLAVNIIKELSERLHGMEHSFSTLQALSVEQRILNLLEGFRKDYGIEHNEGTEIYLPMTQEDMGNRLGVSRESVSRKLNELQDRGALQLLSRKRILLKNAKM